VPSSIRCCAPPGSTAPGEGLLGACVVVFQVRLFPVDVSCREDATRIVLYR